MSHRKVLLPLTTTLVIVLLCSTAWSQRLDGTLRGTVQDPAKAVVSGAKVTITNQDTGVTQTVTTTSAGNFVFPNLIVGPYTVAVEAPSFQKYVRKDVQVLPNQIVTADAMMTVGSPGTTIEVTAGAETVQVNTSQLSNDFGERAVSDLPNPGLGGTPLNLSILAPNTTTQGAGVLGEGGSIGGARPRLNSFNIDGVDDNRVDVTGHTSEVIPEAVADLRSFAERVEGGDERNDLDAHSYGVGNRQGSFRISPVTGRLLQSDVPRERQGSRRGFT